MAPTPVPPAGVPAPTAAGTASAFLQQQQQELQNKILNILNGKASASTAPAVPQPTVQPAKPVAATGYGSLPSGSATRQPSASVASPLINFDNPNVKKALDSLMQSGPNLLKSVQSTVSSLGQVAGYGTQATAGVRSQPAYQQQPQAGSQYGAQAPANAAPAQQAQQGYAAHASQQPQGYGGGQGQYRPQGQAPAARGYGAPQGQRPLGPRPPQMAAQQRY